MTEYALQAEGKSPRLNDRGRIAVIVLSIVAFAALFIVFAYWGFTGGGFTPAGLFVLGGYGFVAVFGGVLLTVVFLAPIPTSVSLSGDGVTFVYHSGKSRTFRWNDPKLRLTLADQSSRIGSGRPPYWLGAPGIRFYGEISRSAFDGLLQAARAAGARVTETGDSSGPGGGTVQFVIVPPLPYAGAG